MFEGHAFLDAASLGEPKEASSSLSKNLKVQLQSEQTAKWFKLAATFKQQYFWQLKKIKREVYCCIHQCTSTFKEKDILNRGVLARGSLARSGAAFLV